MCARYTTTSVITERRGPRNTKTGGRLLQALNPRRLCLSCHQRFISFPIPKISLILHKVHFFWIKAFFQQKIQKHFGSFHPFAYTDFDLCSSKRSILNIIRALLCFSTPYYEKYWGECLSNSILKGVWGRPSGQKGCAKICFNDLLWRAFCNAAVMGPDHETYISLYCIHSAKHCSKYKIFVSHYN